MSARRGRPARGPDPVPDPSVALHLYRIAQEAVTNAVKHSKAQKIEIAVTSENGRCALTVTSDGEPFTDHPQDGMGIAIMRARANAIGATIGVRSNNGIGAVVTCEFRPAS